MVEGAHILGEPQSLRLFEIMGEKLELRELGVEGWLAVVLSAVIGNWLVGMAAFMAAAARTVSGKVIGILLPIIAFAAIGAHHSPANMGYFSLGLIHGGSGVGWGEAIWWVIVPASLGNIVGGAVLVSLLFWFTFGRNAKQCQSLRRAGELVREDQRPSTG